MLIEITLHTTQTRNLYAKFYAEISVNILDKIIKQKKKWRRKKFTDGYYTSHIYAVKGVWGYIYAVYLCTYLCKFKKCAKLPKLTDIIHYNILIF